MRLTRGQAAVELALVLPVLVVLLMIVGEFLRVYYTTIELNNAARAGVQYGIHSPANAANLHGMQQAALNDGSDISGMTAVATEYCECSNGSSVSCGTAGACSDERVYIEVDTAATFHTLTVDGLSESL
jgi:Flp pilus assembly protein TadG